MVGSYLKFLKSSKMTYKTIISGRLEFGTARSYEKVLKMFEHRVENYYKSDIAIKGEDIFVEESTSLNVPRFITQATEKTFRNTLNLLEYIAQYAVAGDLSAWMTENGKVLKHKIIEPTGDKVAVQAYLHGRELVKESGKETEAKAALSRAIEKFERHALAYERRGFVNFQLGNYDDAFYDYSKSIDINPKKAEPYLGRAFIKIQQQDYKAAIVDLEKAIKHSIPLESVYWKCRRVKADCHLKLEDYKAALLDLKLFTKRNFPEGNPNIPWRKEVFFNYGKALTEVADFTDAVKAFDSALAIKEGKGTTDNAEILVNRGLALKKAGQAGFVKDWKEAANQGSKKAAELLEEFA